MATKKARVKPPTLTQKLATATEQIENLTFQTEADQVIIGLQGVEIDEMKAKLLAIAESETEPFVIPDHITDPQHQYVYAVADLTGVLEAVEKSKSTGGSGDFSYTYASVFDMVDLVRPLMAHRGLMLTGTMLIDHDKYQVSEITTGSGRINAWLTLPCEWTLEHYAGGFKAVTLVGEARDSTDKAHNKAFTASRKLALHSLVAISTGDVEDTESEHIVHERAASAQRPAQPTATANSSASQINPRWGECPTHKDQGFYLTDAAKKAGHGASHKDGDGFCEYNTRLEEVRTQVGAAFAEHFGSSPGKPFISWHDANKLNVPARGAFSKWRPVDWLTVAKALAMNPPTPVEAVDEPEVEPGVEVEGQIVCGVELDPDGLGKLCLLPPGHGDEWEHDADPSLTEIATVEKELKESRQA